MAYLKTTAARWTPTVVGSLGLLGMTSWYYGLLWLTTQDPWHPFFFFGEKWYFLAPIIIGFAVQMWLWQRLRLIAQAHHASMTTASAGVSGLAMAACCAHHLADVLPVIGLIGVAGVLTEYQNELLAAAALMQVVGIGYLVIRLHRHELAHCRVN